MNTFFLEIITPEKIAFSDQVAMVTVPSITGILGILPGHTPIFTKLIQGELKIIKNNQETFISLGEGFMEVAEDKVTILVTRAFKADELNEAKLLEAKKQAEEALIHSPGPESIQATQAMIKSILVDLKVLRRKRSSQITP